MKRSSSLRKEGKFYSSNTHSPAAKNFHIKFLLSLAVSSRVERRAAKKFFMNFNGEKTFLYSAGLLLFPISVYVSHLISPFALWTRS
jgi:hypothetical protein